MIELAVVVVIILCTSAMCSLFEAVLYSVPVSRVETLERAGRRSGRHLRELREHVDRPIAAILSLNTIANTGGGALAGAIAAEAMGERSVVYFAVAFTLAILMLSEILPKTVGVVFAPKLAPFIARPLKVLVVAMAPLVWLTRLGTAAISKKSEQRVSDDELLTLVGLGLRSGDFTPHEARVIANVLSLETKRVRQILTPRPVVFALPAETTVRDAAAHAELQRYSRVPVYDETIDDVIGFVHKIDVLTAIAQDRFEVRLEELMRPIQFVVDSATLDQTLRMFLERRIHLAAVMDEFGAFAGIVTLEDVVEELIGREIVDESDHVSDLREVAHRRRDEILGRRPRTSR